jgi:hypothetical protein
MYWGGKSANIIWGKKNKEKKKNRMENIVYENLGKKEIKIGWWECIDILRGGKKYPSLMRCEEKNAIFVIRFHPGYLNSHILLRAVSL